LLYRDKEASEKQSQNTAIFCLVIPVFCGKFSNPNPAKKRYFVGTSTADFQARGSTIILILRGPE
jgi:hypothetical protein